MCFKHENMGIKTQLSFQIFDAIPWYANLINYKIVTDCKENSEEIDY